MHSGSTVDSVYVQHMPAYTYNIALRSISIIIAYTYIHTHLTTYHIPVYTVYCMQVIEMEAEETLRRAELSQADREATYKFSREVRREKSHWRIASNRKNVILRTRPRYQAILAQVQYYTALAWCMLYTV